MKKIITFLLIINVLGCSGKKLIDEKRKNLWRFNDPHINQIIIQAWSNINNKRFMWGVLDFERLISKQYIDYDIMFGAGVGHFESGNYKKSLYYFNEAIKLNNDHFDAHYYRAMVYFKLGYKNKAIDDLKYIIGLKKSKNYICGLYPENNDIADDSVLIKTQHKAKKLINAVLNNEI